MSFIYQNIDGTGLSQKEWQAKAGCEDWITKQYRNEKIWVRVIWIGRYRKDLPAEYRHTFQVEVLNRVKVRSIYDEDTLEDKGWVIDPAATESFRAKSQAEQRYEDLLISYTKSYFEEDEDGEIVLVEEENELGVKKQKGSLKLEINEQVEEAAKEKGISLGGWS